MQWPTVTPRGLVYYPSAMTRRMALLQCLLIIGGCARAARAPSPPPETPAIDLAPFRRVWIAGFLATPNADIDVNGETVTLLRKRLNPRTPLRVIEAPPLAIHTEDELLDGLRWRRLGEEYSEPLIVTGSLTFAAARPVAAESPSSRPIHRLRKGYVLEATFLFIDGRTGEVLARQVLPRETLYETGQRTSTLSLYFQLMERVLPPFLRVFQRAMQEPSA